MREGFDGARPVVVIANFGPQARRGYRLGLPRPGRWRELLNTDAAVYGGSGVGNAGLVMAKPTPLNGQAWSATLTLPPLAVLWIAPEQD